MVDEVFDYNVCSKCSRRDKKSCPYRNMSLLQYCEHKGIPYEFKNAGKEIVINTSNLMNSSAMIELKNEVHRTKNSIADSGGDYMVIK